MAKLDLNLIVIFDAVMRERSVSVAAETLNMTQPSVSKAINRMRHHWQDPLFVKQGRGIQPTPFAINLWNQISNPIKQIEQQLLTPEFDPNNTPSTIRVACTDGITHVFWPYIREVIEDRANAINIHAVPFKGNGEQLLLSAETDLVFDYFPDQHPHIHSEFLLDNHFTCAMRKSHPLSNQILTLEHFTQADHLFVSLSGDARGTVDSALNELGQKRRIAMTVNSFSSAIDLLLQSNLIATLPKTVIRSSIHRDQLVEVPLPLSVKPAPISLAWHKRKDNSPAIKWLIKEIRQWKTLESTQKLLQT